MRLSRPFLLFYFPKNRRRLESRPPLEASQVVGLDLGLRLGDDLAGKMTPLEGWVLGVPGVTDFFFFLGGGVVVATILFFGLFCCLGVLKLYFVCLLVCFGLLVVIGLA